MGSIDHKVSRRAALELRGAFQGGVNMGRQVGFEACGRDFD